MNKIYLFLTVMLVSMFSMGTAINATESADGYFYLTCPNDVTIQCGDDIHNLDQYGVAYIHSSSGYYQCPTNPVVYYNLNDCGLGVIVRTWSVMGPDWQWHTCSQVIHVVGGGFKPTSISWPPDYTHIGCTDDVHPNVIPAPFNRPKVNYAPCSQVGIGFDDWVFTLEDGCKKIVRTWKIIDWCTYKPNSGSNKGIYMYNQTIKIMSSGSVHLTCPDDIHVSSGANCSGIYVEIPEVVVTSDCDHRLIHVTHNSPYADRQGRDASGTYPIGVTHVTFTVKQACGAVEKCTFKIVVKDDKQPNPICTDAIISVLMPIDSDNDGIFDRGMVVVDAKSFNIASSNGCGTGALRFSWSPDPTFTHRTFTCEELGYNPVDIYVTDANGNQNFCSTEIVIQNNSGIIDCFPTIPEPDSIFGWMGGLLSSADDIPLKRVNIEVSYLDIDTTIVTTYDTIIVTIIDTLGFDDNNNPILQITETKTVTPVLDTLYNNFIDTIQAGYGSYSIDTLPVGKSYNIRPFKNDPFQRYYINYDDIIAMLDHINGNNILDNPYKLLAADVNQDKLINNDDILVVLSKIRRNTNHDSIQLVWNFVPAEFHFSDPNDPFIEPNIPNSIIIDPLTTPVLDAHFIGYKLGDVDNTGFDRRSSSKAYFTVVDKEVQAGVPTQIEIRYDQSEVKFVHLNLDLQNAKNLNHDKDSYVLESDDEVSYISSSINGTISLEIIPTESGLLSKVLLLSQFNESVVISNSNDVRDIAFRFVTSVDENSSFTSVSVYPNPFKGMFNIDFDSMNEESMEINVYNVEGKLIFTRPYRSIEGFNNIQFERSIIGASGVYIYELKSETSKVMGKIIAID